MKNTKEIIEYWIKTARHDYKTMQSLFESKRYSDSLFYGHIVLEKVLKALVIQKTKEHAKPIHNLLILLQKTDVKLEKDDLEFLTEINKFNIKTRYPDYKLLFYKTCNLKYTESRLKKIKFLYKKLCQQIKN